MQYSSSLEDMYTEKNTKDIWLIRFHEGIGNWVAFYICPEDLCETAMKSTALICVVKDILKQGSIQIVKYIY